MKVIDLIKYLEKLDYDDETEFAVCVFNPSIPDIKLYEGKSLLNVVRNADCSGINMIGINILGD